MEQKRVLWIVAAVGLFLLVVIGTALWISSPSSLPSSGLAWTSSDAQLLSLNNTSDVASLPSSGTASNSYLGQNEIKEVNFASDANAQNPVNLNTLETPSSNVTSAAENNPAAAQPAPSSPASSDSKSASAGLAQTAVTLNVNITPSSSSASASAENVQKSVSPSSVQPAASDNRTSQQPVAQAPAAANAPVTEAADTAPAAKTTSKTESTPANTTAAPVRTTAESSSASNSVKTVPVIQPDKFWVQVASFTGKKNAEDAREALAEQKINGEVFTHQDSSGTIYYRLRVGPYKTKSEAEYWHKIIKEIEQFDGTDSYVVNSTVK
ncbi:MAG: SPOR domain-containing protein [Treponemataceae bacterium]|nr:SPOR domain-containing protein [Treponemataceae bacterium]